MKFSDIYKRYWPYIKGYKRYFVFVFIGILFTVTATASIAKIMQFLIDDVFIDKDPSMLYIIPSVLIGVYILKGIGKYIQAVFTTHIGLHIVARLREDLLEKMVRMDMSFHYANRSGELISRITNDIARVQYFVSTMMPELIRESLIVIALVGTVIYLNPTLAFWALIVVPIIIFPLSKITRRLKKLSHHSQEKNADVVTRLTEVFNNTEIIKANATETYEINRFHDENERFFKLNMKTSYTSELVSPLMEIIGAAGLAAVIFVGGQQVYSGAMTPGEFTGFITAVGQMFDPIRRVSSIYSKIQDSQAASERVFAVFDIENEIKEGTIELQAPIHNIDIQHATLRFGDKIALDTIDLSVHTGQTIALVGQSGGGKSSLINLILRFYDPESGSISINQRNIKEYTQSSLRHQIAAVSQRVYILQETLAANVAYGQEIDEERVKEALCKADALEFVSALPEGIHTVMQEFGANLSGGQRQRIAIARAIYKNASLLILDEATSALDNESEKRIQKALEAYAKDKITIIIAHRLSTIEHADTILYFEEGRIIARGSHQELLQTSENYRRLAGKMGS